MKKTLHIAAVMLVAVGALASASTSHAAPTKGQVPIWFPKYAAAPTKGQVPIWFPKYAAAPTKGQVPIWFPK